MTPATRSSPQRRRRSTAGWPQEHHDAAWRPMPVAYPPLLEMPQDRQTSVAISQPINDHGRRITTSASSTAETLGGSHHSKRGPLYVRVNMDNCSHRRVDASRESRVLITFQLIPRISLSNPEAGDAAWSGTEGSARGHASQRFCTDTGVAGPPVPLGCNRICDQRFGGTQQDTPGSNCWHGVGTNLGPLKVVWMPLVSTEDDVRRLAMSLTDVVEKTFNQSSDTDFEAKKNRCLSFTTWLMAGKLRRSGPRTVVCMDEFGRSTCHLACRQWAPVIVKGERGEARPAAPTAPCHLHSHCPSFAT